jgi:hypothetical protein
MNTSTWLWGLVPLAYLLLRNMRLTDILLLSAACFAAYGFIDPDGALSAMTGAYHATAAIVRG